ncbi:APC family permease [Nonomuraea sp. NPDC048826]|uniref:APC family permease n=1 Tax=Nonomuraea sp. NPDC048826 TaxID=3364347 RepID=UPI00371D525F
MSSEPPNVPTTPHLRRVLGLPSLVLFGLAYMVPLTVFTTYGIVTEMTAGHLPGAYVVTLTAMLFTAYSYGRMVQAHPYAGSAYTYTQKSFGPHLGFMAGWALLLDYVFLPMINYLVIGIYLNAAFEAIPAWVWVLAAIALVTGLNVLGIQMVSRMNFILIGIQVVFVVVFLAGAVRAIAGEPMPSIVEPFFSAGTDLSMILGGAAILCLSFLGFDAVSTLSEETRDPRRRVPRAIMLTTLAGGVLFILISYVGHLAFPDWQSFTDADSAALDVMGHVGGALLTAFFTASYISGAFASAMTSQASVSRILYAMGRDGVLPKRFFGYVHPRFRNPVRATLAVGAISLVALVISLELASAMVSFGALVAFSFVNLSVIKHYVVNEGRRTPQDLVKYGVVPAVGLLLCLWLWTSLSGLTFVVGLSWVGAGFVYLLGLTRMFTRRPPELHFNEVEPDDETEPAPAAQS